jgi:hypothetical protein
MLDGLETRYILDPILSHLLIGIPYCAWQALERPVVRIALVMPPGAEGAKVVLLPETGEILYFALKSVLSRIGQRYFWKISVLPVCRSVICTHSSGICHLIRLRAVDLSPGR